MELLRLCVIFRLLLLLLLPPLFFCCTSTHGTCYSVYIVAALCLVSVAGWPAPLPTCTTHCWLVDVVKDNVSLPLSIIAVLYLLGQMGRKGMNKKERRKNYVQNFQVLGKKKKQTKQNTTDKSARISNRRHTQIPPTASSGQNQKKSNSRKKMNKCCTYNCCCFFLSPELLSVLLLKKQKKCSAIWTSNLEIWMQKG